MKRIVSAILCVFLLAAADPAAFAESPGENGERSAVETMPEVPQEEALPAAALYLDTQNAYAGMTGAYKDGYTPTVTGGTAVVVLPLAVDGALKGDVLTASLDLGTTAGSPFVYTNYQKTVPLSEQTINGGEGTKKLYYVRFDLALSAGRCNGVYPVTVNISAEDTAGNDIVQSYPVYVTVSDGADPDAEETAVPSPVVLVSGCTIQPETVQAGEEFTLEVTIFNTSGSMAVQNMVVEATCDSGDFTLLDHSKRYLSGLGAGESATLTLHYQTSRNTAEGQYAIALSMSYSDEKAVPASSSGTVNVAIKQPQNVAWTVPDVAESVNAGDTLPLSFQVLNLGRSKLYNVRCDVSGYGLLPTGTAFIGDMEAGTEGNASLNLFVGAKDLSGDYTGSEKYGSTTGTFTLTYEDAEGTEYTREATFTTAINKPVISARSDDSQQEKSAGQWWISVTVCAVLILAILGGLAVRRWKKKYEAI